MDKFSALYVEYCKNYNVDIQEAVKSELRRVSLSSDETAKVLNLSSNHLTDKTCMVLSKLLAHDQHFYGLELNDCSLSSDAIRDICHALSTNSSIRSLGLKGNNIHGEGIAHVAKVLRQNAFIKSISLEWNSLGLLDSTSFSQFCESLSMNKSLKDLDLRNNQLTHASAIEIASALESNATLQDLDLRWNNIGLVGGKALLQAMKKNHTLSSLQLSGNNIPEDIIEAIEAKIQGNLAQVKVNKDYASRTTVLANELQNVQFQKNKQINLLLGKIDLQEEAARKANRTLSEKMKKLQMALEDRLATVNTLTSKLTIAEADLALSEQKCLDLEHTVKKLQADKENEVKSVNLKSKRDRDDLVQEKNRIERDLNDFELRYKKLEEKNRELEKKCQELQLTAYEAKEKLAHGSAEYQIKMAALDEEARRLKQKHKDEIKEVESAKQREGDKIRHEHEANEKSLRDRINKLESMKHSLEDELSRMKTTMANDKLAYEQEVHELKLKAHHETNTRSKEVDERVRSLQAAKDDLITENSKLNAKVVDLNQKISSLTYEIEALKKNNDSLRQQLHDKEIENMQSNERQRSDFDKRLRSIQKDIERTDEYKTRVSELELKLKKLETENQILMSKHQMEEEKSKAKIKGLENIVESFDSMLKMYRGN